MHNIDNSHQLHELIVECTGYFDSVTLGISRHLKKFERDYFEPFCGSINYRSVGNKDLPFFCVVDGNRIKTPFELTLKQPTEGAIRLLLNLMSSSGLKAVPWGLEVSLDWITNTPEEALRLHRILDRTIFKRGKGRAKEAQIIDKGSGRTTNIGPRGRPCQLSIYSGRLSKIKNGKPCCHLEWRAVSRRSVMAAGLNSVERLLTFSHRNFWGRKLKLYHINFEKLGKRLRDKHLNSKPDIYRSGNFSWNRYENYAKSYIYMNAVAQGIDPHSMLFIEKILLLKRLGISNLLRILVPISTKGLLPFNQGVMTPPPARQ